MKTSASLFVSYSHCFTLSYRPKSTFFFWAGGPYSLMLVKCLAFVGYASLHVFFPFAGLFIALDAYSRYTSPLFSHRSPLRFLPSGFFQSQIFILHGLLCSFLLFALESALSPHFFLVVPNFHPHVSRHFTPADVGMYLIDT